MLKSGLVITDEPHVLGYDNHSVLRMPNRPACLAELKKGLERNLFVSLEKFDAQYFTGEHSAISQASRRLTGSSPTAKAETETQISGLSRARPKNTVNLFHEKTQSENLL